MKYIAIPLCIASLTLGSTAFGQERKPEGTDKKPVPAAGEQVVHLYKHSDLNDLDLKNGDKSIGELDGIIIDSTDGRIVFAMVGKGGVLGIGEKEHLIPWESIKVTAKDPAKNEGAVARTNLTAEQIEAAPVFKKKEPIDATLVRRVRENAKLPSDSSWERIAGTNLVCSPDLKGSSVRSPDDKDLGNIDEIVVSADDGMIAYVVLGAGGVLGLGEKHVALPLSMIECSYDKDGKLVVHSPLTKEKVEKAPEYTSKDWKRMAEGNYVREVSTYWGKEPYWIRTTPAGAGKQ